MKLSLFTFLSVTIIISSFSLGASRDPQDCSSCYDENPDKYGNSVCTASYKSSGENNTDFIVGIKGPHDTKIYIPLRGCTLKTDLDGNLMRLCQKDGKKYLITDYTVQAPGYQDHTLNAYRINIKEMSESELKQTKNFDSLMYGMSLKPNQPGNLGDEKWKTNQDLILNLGFASEKNVTTNCYNEVSCGVQNKPVPHSIEICLSKNKDSTFLTEIRRTETGQINEVCEHGVFKSRSPTVYSAEPAYSPESKGDGLYRSFSVSPDMNASSIEVTGTVRANVEDESKKNPDGSIIGERKGINVEVKRCYQRKDQNLSEEEAEIKALTIPDFSSRIPTDPRTKKAKTDN